MKKLFSLILSALLIAGSATVAFAWEKGDEYISLFTQKYPNLAPAYGDNYPSSVKVDGMDACTTGELLMGTVATSTDYKGRFAWNDIVKDYPGMEPGYTPYKVFDGNKDSFYQSKKEFSFFPFMILDEAHELTEVRFYAYPTKGFKTEDQYIQGSNDGENWATIIDLPATEADGWLVFTPDSEAWVGSGSYSIYRIVTADTDVEDGNADHNNMAEVELYGNPAEATVLTENDRLPVDLNYYAEEPQVDVGPMAGFEMVEREEGELVGKIIGANVWYIADDPTVQYQFGHAFDGDLDTYFDGGLSSPLSWIGIQVDEPTILTNVTLYMVKGRLDRMDGSYIQGSNDGHNWTTLYEYSVAQKPASYDTPVEAEIVTDQAFTYFRYVNIGLAHAEASEIFFFGEPAAE